MFCRSSLYSFVIGLVRYIVSVFSFDIVYISTKPTRISKTRTSVHALQAQEHTAAHIEPQYFGMVEKFAGRVKSLILAGPPRFVSVALTAYFVCIIVCFLLFSS